MKRRALLAVWGTLCNGMGAWRKQKAESEFLSPRIGALLPLDPRTLASGLWDSHQQLLNSSAFSLGLGFTPNFLDSQALKIWTGSPSCCLLGSCQRHVTASTNLQSQVSQFAQ